ncbi:MAG: hypothetical protein OXH11_15895 [Candidatus Aminicenantes bacterium]|nr:hypothetical protein [Candidatus Aminicenantes bacterium]
MTTTLLFDDQRLNRLDNVVRKLGRPERISDAIYRDPHGNPAFGYPSVFSHEETGTWRMSYQIHVGQGRGIPHAQVLAESRDGLEWKLKDTTGEIDLADRRYPHQIATLEEHTEWASCFVDERAGPEERLKAFKISFPDGIAGGGRAVLLASPDGIRWTPRERGAWLERAADPGVFAFWNEVRRSYVVLTRPEVLDRRIAAVETTDWQNYTDPELVIQPDALDAPLTEPYGMPVFPYEGYYIAFLWLFHTVPWDPNIRRFQGGHVDCQLAYSLNGWHWNRGLRDPFIPNGGPGEPDSGCGSLTVMADGSLLIYASACTHEHGVPPAGSGSIVVYRLRRDGFCFLESGGGPGLVGIRPVYWNGGEVDLNVASQGGRVRAQVTDQMGTPMEGYGFDVCQPFSGDDAAWTPHWKDGRKMAALCNCFLRLEIELDSARLYAIRGDYVKAMPRDIARHREYGDLPEPGIGW